MGQIPVAPIFFKFYNITLLFLVVVRLSRDNRPFTPTLVKELSTSSPSKLANDDTVTNLRYLVKNTEFVLDLRIEVLSLHPCFP